jgi:glutathione synthase/RimK-type ligase-like ATP-grasp enzyme
MCAKTIAGIRRGNQFSPNHIGNDAAIFSLTVEQLREKGYHVNEYTESDLLTKDLREDTVFNMVRDWYSVRKLQQLEDSGRLVINSGYGIENCTREKMTRLFMSANIPSPRSIILRTDVDPVAALEKAGFTECWIKRNDFHAIHREDVTYVRHIEEAESILKEYAMRGIATAVINEHLVGDLVKFYGVVGTDFFYWFYPDMNHSKFGLEKINGKAHEIPFDKYALRQLCNEAARELNVVIYGGDCIIDQHGTIRLIDFNDWPSFAPCRRQAAPYIATCIHHLITA